MLGLMNTNIHLNTFVYVYVLKEFPRYVYFYMYIVMKSLLFIECIDLSQLKMCLKQIYIMHILHPINLLSK